MAIKQMLRWLSYSFKFVSISQYSSFYVATAVFGEDLPTFDMKKHTIRIVALVSGDDFFRCNVFGIKLR